MQESSDLLKNLLLGNTSFFVARLGSVESDILINYLPELRVYSEKISMRGALRLSKEAWISAGIWPPTRRNFKRFSNQYWKALNSANVIACWNDNKLASESKILSKLNHPFTRLQMQVLDPAYLAAYVQDPWTNYLAGKKVLVVSSFASIITQQFNKISTLHSNPLIPYFDLNVIQPPISNGLSISVHHWELQLKNFLIDLDKIVISKGVEIALVSAGSYGLPITSHLSNRGIKSIYVGGALQLYFGIWGNRWRSSSLVQNLATENWISPPRNTKPRLSNYIENSAYW
jgi:hypothetical protein